MRVGPDTVVPVVPAAVVFDLGKGGDPGKRPDAELGYAAAAAASAGPVQTGCVGAGTGASFSLPALKGGVGTASIRLEGGIVVAALVVANAYGSPCAPASGSLLAANLVEDEALRPRTPDPRDLARAVPAGEPGSGTAPAGGPLNTTLAVVATNARLSHSQTHRMATAGHDGIARAIRPAHTLVDGDAVFGLATGQIDPALGALGSWPGAAEIGGIAAVQAAAADAVSLAVVDAILAATSVRTPAIELRSYLDRHPSARPIGYPRPRH